MTNSTTVAEARADEASASDGRCSLPLSRPVQAPGPAGAEIVLTLRSNGLVYIRSTCRGNFDASYADMTDERMLTCALPRLLRELRGQLSEAG